MKVDFEGVKLVLSENICMKLCLASRIREIRKKENREITMEKLF